jgi:hypothetical protein
MDQSVQDAGYINRRLIARAVRSSQVTARLRSVIFRELVRAREALPRGTRAAPVRGRELAVAILDAMAELIRKGAPGPTGFAVRICADLHRKGYLDTAKAPCARTAREALELAASVTPLINRPGNRQYTLFLAEDMDPDELQIDLQRWREAVSRRDEDLDCAVNLPDGVTLDAVQDVQSSENAAPSITIADRAPPVRRTALSYSIAENPSLEGVPVPISPRTRARAGTSSFFSGATGAASKAEAPQNLTAKLQAIPRGCRWLAPCLRALEAGPIPGADLAAAVLAFDPSVAVTARERWCLRRAAESIERRGVAVLGERGWSLAQAEQHRDLEIYGLPERAEQARPSRRMRRFLERRGVDARGLGRRDASRLQRRLYQRGKDERLTHRQVLRVAAEAGADPRSYRGTMLLDAGREEFEGIMQDARIGMDGADLADACVPPRVEQRVQPSEPVELASEKPSEPRLAPKLETRDKGEEMPVADEQQEQVGRRANRWGEFLVMVSMKFGSPARSQLELTGGRSGDLVKLVKRAGEEGMASAEEFLSELADRQSGRSLPSLCGEIDTEVCKLLRLAEHNAPKGEVTTSDGEWNHKVNKWLLDLAADFAALRAKKENDDDDDDE